MIVCHRYQFIFLKTHKTAGSSLEIALSRFCGEGDILTPFGPDEESLRERPDYQGAQNYWLPFKSYTRRDWWNLLHGRRRVIPHHFRADQVRELVGETVWNSYAKLSIERNPWDKAVSLYFYSTRNRSPRPPMMEFYEWAASKKLLSNFPVYAIRGQIVADHIMRYEQLEQDIARVPEWLGLPEPLDVPHANSSSRKDKRHYSQVLGPQERDLISRVCAREITSFGYEYEDQS